MINQKQQEKLSRGILHQVRKKGLKSIEDTQHKKYFYVILFQPLTMKRT